jgi:lysophospholipase L1-like esterase
MKTGATLLFQGDSITDGNRGRNNDLNHILGHGYAFLLASQAGFKLPAHQLHFINKGISGNKVPDLAARWVTDTLNYKPQLLSILVGINDTTAAVNGQTDFTPATYEAAYSALLQQTRQMLPEVQLVILEPFILPVGQVKAQLAAYQAELQPRQAAARQLAQQFDAVFVPLQAPFSKAVAKAPMEYWVWDGIHPTAAGHALLAHEWATQVGKRWKFLRNIAG